MDNPIEIQVDSIEVAKKHRGPIAETINEIAASIGQVGLLSPIAVRRMNGQLRLIAGRQRLEAFRLLGRPTIPGFVYDDDDVRARIRELDENLCRAELTPAREAATAYERKQLYEATYPETKTGGASGKREKGSKGGKVAKVATLPRYTAKVAKATGKSERLAQLVAQRGKQLSGQTLYKIENTSLDEGKQLDALVKIKAMDTDDGDKIVAMLISQAVKGEEVNAHTECGKLQRGRRERDLAEKIAMAAEVRDEVVYGVILTDPPWSRETWSEAGKSRDPSNQYPTQSEEYLSELSIPAADDCILFMWSTQEHLAQAMRLLGAWGFTYKSGAVWVKPKISTGYWFRTQHELLLVATRGKPVAPAAGTQMSSVFEAPVGKHSVKPPIIHEMIERLWPETSKLEMFARAARPGWALWGAEAPEDEPANQDVA